MKLRYRDWTFDFDHPPSSGELEKLYERRVTKTEFRLPIPGSPTLKRRSDGDDASRRIAVLLGGSPRWEAPVRLALERSGHEVFGVDGAGVDRAQDPVHALVVDATAIRDTRDVIRLQASLRASLTRVTENGRLLFVLSGEGDDSHQASARAAVVGLVRSLPNELGRSGITVNALSVAAGDEEALAGPVEFLTSRASAFVDGELIEVDGRRRTRSSGPRTGLVVGEPSSLWDAFLQAAVFDETSWIVSGGPETEKNSEHTRVVRGDIDRLVQLAKERGGVDVIVAFAPFGGRRDGEMPPSFDDGVREPLELLERLEGESLLNDDARVALVASLASWVGSATVTEAAIAGSGAYGLTRWFAPRWRDRGISINTLNVGYVDASEATDMLPRGETRFNGLKQAAVLEDVVEALKFLTSPSSGGVSGQILRLCGAHTRGR